MLGIGGDEGLGGDDVRDRSSVPSSSSVPSTPEKSKKPYVGMFFSSIEEAFDFYQEYGKNNGFCVRKRTMHRTLRGPEITRVTYVCHREGVHKSTSGLGDTKKKKRTASTIKTNCKARLLIYRDLLKSGWNVTAFNDEHNHCLVTPTKRVCMRSYRHMSDSAKNLAEIFRRQNLQVSKVPVVYGGSISNAEFNPRDCYNHLKRVRDRRLKGGDAHAMLCYFQKKRNENPHFTYSIQCDEDGTAVNFFWVDARCRMAYDQFGDVVTFDTTYKTNKYKMPFAPFTGVNHHRNSILFGCALIQDETEDTFLWLFDVWVKAMGGRNPVSIITDQDMAMKNAIEKKFPNTRHRFCLWHIKKKFGEKLGHLFKKKSDFKRAVKRCTRYTYTIEDFEEQWASLMTAYGLEDHKWLIHLYKMRSQWIPVYLRDTFFAGMNTTQRSESMNSFFDQYVKSKTCLDEFVVKFEDAVEKIYVTERDEDFVSRHKERVLQGGNFLLRHASKVYTRNMFNEFQKEFDEVYRFRADVVEIDGEYRKFKVQSMAGRHEEFFVTFNLESKLGTCGCQLYEFMGLPCRHLLTIFQHQFLNEIPSPFVMQRWTKFANQVQVIGSEGFPMHDSHLGLTAMRISQVCRLSTQLAYLASNSDEATSVVIGCLQEAFSKIKEMDDIRLQEEYTIEPVSESSKISIQPILGDPHISITKGRPGKPKESVLDIDGGSGRIKSGMEKSKESVRTCKTCKISGHDRRNCPKRSKDVGAHGSGMK